MSTIVRYILISVKKNFTYKMNGLMVIIDSVIDCFSIWLFWSSLLEMGITVPGWNDYALQLFMGFSLISASIAVLFVGSYDIERHILKGSLDDILLRPCNPVLYIMAERANFLRFLVMYPVGLVLVYHGVTASSFWIITGAVIMCMLSTVSVKMISIIIYEMSFFIKKVDSIYEVISSMTIIADYPLFFLKGKVRFILTYLLPITLIATIPVEFILHGLNILLYGVPLCLLLLEIFCIKIIWKAGRDRYESTN